MPPPPAPYVPEAPPTVAPYVECEEIEIRFELGFRDRLLNVKNTLTVPIEIPRMAGGTMYRQKGDDILEPGESTYYYSQVRNGGGGLPNGTVESVTFSWKSLSPDCPDGVAYIEDRLDY